MVENVNTVLKFDSIVTYWVALQYPKLSLRQPICYDSAADVNEIVFAV